MLDFAVDALATHRLTKLLFDDQILDGPRAKVQEALHVAGWEKALELTRCPWCLGWWCAVGVVTARLIAPRAWRPVGRALACADVAGIIASIV